MAQSANAADGELRSILMRARSSFWAVAGFSVVVNLLMLVSPIYMLQLYDRVLTSGSEQTLILLTVIALFLLGTLALLDAMRARIMTRIGVRFEADIKGRIFDRVLRRVLVSGSSAGGAQAMRDLEQIRQFLSGTAIFALFDSPFTPLFLILIFTMHPLLGMIALIGAILIFTIAYMTEMLSRKEVRAAGALSIASNNFMDAGLRNADALEAMGMSENVSGIWRKRHDPAVALQARAANKVSSLLALSKAIRFSLQVLILGAGGWLAIEQVVTPGVMIAASIIMGRALAPVEQAIGAWRGIVQVRAAYSRVDELLTTMPDRTEGTDLPNPKGLLEAENVVAALPGMTEPLIKGVSLKVEPGQIHGIIGPSGAGKSTLGRLLVGVLPTVRGAVRLDGAELINWHPEQRGRHVGYLPQDAALFDGTVAQNISRFDPEGTDDQIITAAQAAGVHDMILRLPQGYDSAVGEGGSNLSGGERQRIALARTLYKDPVLLVLDEPNAALDAEGQQALARAILNAKKRGAGIVLITHDVRFASIADQLTVIKEGAVSLSGPRDEVLARTTKRANPPAQQVTQQAAQTDPTQPTAPEAN